MIRHNKVILWGLTGTTGDTFAHIFRHYAHALEAAAKPWLWVPDSPLSRTHIEADDLVFAVDVAAKHLGAPVEGADYLLHNVMEDHPVRQGLDPARCVYLQVWTNDCEERGEPWGPVRRWDGNARVLYQPWGTDLLPDEFGSAIWNPDSREVAFVGSIWDGNGQGNHLAIAELKVHLEARGLEFCHRAGVSDAHNAQLVREARVAPAIAGGWQVEHEYLPCRVFKNISYGTLGITNVPRFREILGDAAVVDGDMGRLLDFALGLEPGEWTDLVQAQQEIVREHFTYATSLEMIGRAFDS